MEAGQTSPPSLLCCSKGMALVGHKHRVVLMTLTNGTGSRPPNPLAPPSTQHLPLHLSASTLLDLAMPLVHLCSDAGRPHASKNTASVLLQLRIFPLERGELKDAVQLLSHPFLWNSPKFADEPPGP